MKLKRVHIYNYRSIKDQSFNFSPSCRVLVGINESGKSNLLNAISLLSPEYEPEPGDAREESSDERGTYITPEVRFIFEIEKDDYDFIYELLEEKIKGPMTGRVAKRGDKHFTVKQYCQTFKEVLYRVMITDNNKFVSFWSNNLLNYELTDGWKKPSSTCPSDFKFTDENQDTNTLKSYVLVKPKEEWSIPDSYLEDAKFDDFRNLVKEVVEKHLGDSLPEIVYWAYDESQLLPEKVNLNEFVQNPSKHAPLQSMFVLAGKVPIADEIAKARERGETQLNNLLRRVAEKNTAHFQEVWREYRDIKFSLRMNGDFIQCSVSERNDYPFLKRSDGFKRFVAFLLTVSAKSKTGDLLNAVLLIDEPDSGLHPSGARCLRDELISISKNNHVVFSTHSIFMIDRFNIGRHVIVKKNKEITTLEDATEGNVVSEEVLFNALNYTAFEHLQSKNILFEGWFDKQLCSVATKTHEKSFFSKLGLCHAVGVKSYKWFVPILELAERNAVIISDSDVSAKQAQAEYKKLHYKTEWLTYADFGGATAKTGEDFLKKSYLVSTLEDVTRGKGKEIILTESDLPNDNRIQAVSSKLITNGYTDAEAKETTDKWKEQLFEKLTKSHIEDRYFKFLDEVKKKIHSLK
ncbi:MAG: hypothetical protein Athens041674_703 [Parcubacteria group bacterium Athens0416_74]|nr:MAG: hypothetical protein Athens041674_703 [Parcubacteria group bacterium Athens0416_74]